MRCSKCGYLDEYCACNQHERPEVSCACGTQAMHSIYQNGEIVHKCCRCYVLEGGTPADWHTLCMETHQEIQAGGC